MKLAKDCIDIGIQTNKREVQLSFWQDEVGLPFEELLKVGGGSHQLRHSLNGSIFKLNHSRAALPDLASSGKSGYDELLIARDGLTEPKILVDPDGNKITLVPPGQFGITHIGIRLVVRDLGEFQNFYNNILQIEQIDDTTFRWGTTILLLTEDPDHRPVKEMRGVGFRYITVQVWKVDEEHSNFLQRGGTEASAPRTLGQTARISFILDPDRNWIEVSQRASLTGDLSS
ncbi:MAG: VOC family protein [bacterium]|nr:VOC family protein [Gammaproteobacteria bacterium]HIL94645.1 VOC family protein [Pseudomonadales bacterium]